MKSTDAIFLLVADERLKKVPYAPYPSEDVLQDLIARYPELIVGEQIDRQNPPRWLLVSREAGIPDAEETSDRWSLDHLLLDQRAIPTLVEVKRSSDTRIRREVIGQMLDYAANATRYWPVNRIRSLAATQAGGIEQFDERIRELLDPGGGDVDVESYWTQVEENLRAGRLRLLFVADELPRELRRVIEFLNEHMPKIEVLGIEVREYASGDLRMLVPRVVGQTERARDVKRPPAPARKLDETTFLAACPPWAKGFFQELWSAVGALAQDFPVGIRWGSEGFRVRRACPDGRQFSVLAGHPPGIVGSKIPFLQISLKETTSPDDLASLRSALVPLDGYREVSPHTIRIFLEEVNLSRARAALPHIWALYRRICENDG